MFNTVTSQILNMDPLAIVSNVYVMIIKEKRCRIVARNKETRAQAVAFVARTKEKSSLFCTVCTKARHVAVDCYK